MLAAQHGVCAICRRTCRTGRSLVVDHDHATNVVRGLLCNGCNLVLGYMNDDVELLQAAIRYLQGESP
jgi:hypothetical protein